MLGLGRKNKQTNLNFSTGIIVIQRPQPLAGFVLGCPKFNSSVMLVNLANWFASGQLGFFTLWAAMKSTGLPVLVLPLDDSV